MEQTAIERLQPAPRVPADAASLWERFAVTRDPGLREQLIRLYTGFARIMAAKAYANRVMDEMEFDDYLQYATVGLIEALDRFEPQRGIKFETFAGRRVSGAILDGLARANDMQEQIAARKRLVAERTSSLAGEGEAGTGAAEDVFARLAELAIGLAVGFALEDSGMHQEQEGHYPDNSYRGVELKQLQARLRAAIQLLAPTQRQVVYSHYMQHMPFEQIAAELGVTRGRVSQIHKEALCKLRMRLRRTGELELSC